MKYVNKELVADSSLTACYQSQELGRNSDVWGQVWQVSRVIPGEPSASHWGACWRSFPAQVSPKKPHEWKGVLTLAAMGQREASKEGKACLQRIPSLTTDQFLTHKDTGLALSPLKLTTSIAAWVNCVWPA